MTSVPPMPWTTQPRFGDPPVGALMAFAGQLGASNPAAASPPAAAETGDHVTEPLEAWGWMLCDGRSLSIYLYPELFAALGYVYGGSGDSFAIPDYRGAFWRGVDAGAGVDPDLSKRTALGAGAATGVGSKQLWAVQDHEHSYLYAQTSAAPAPSGDAAGAPLGIPTLTQGGPVSPKSPQLNVQVSDFETRPTNIAVNYIIKFTSGLGPTVWR